MTHACKGHCKTVFWEATSFNTIETVILSTVIEPFAQFDNSRMQKIVSTALVYNQERYEGIAMERSLPVRRALIQHENGSL